MNTATAIKHTPGPWAVLPEEADKAYIRIRGTRLGGKYKVANVPLPSHDTAPDWDVEESRSNARLIAAAPELLEALREARHVLSDLPSTAITGTRTRAAWERATAAIAKAEAA